MSKLSVVISAYNEERKIKDCLESIKWAEEIIFIDNNSSDKTVQIAEKYTSKIFKRENNLMLNVNKNFGFTKATGDWILSLDADERVTSELREEIIYVLKNPKSEIRNPKQIINSNDQNSCLPVGKAKLQLEIRNLKFEIGNSNINGYWIPRKNMIFGKWIEHMGWYPDCQLRLIRRGKGKFPEKHVHEMIEVEGETATLKENIIHYNFETVSQFLRKHITIYAPNEASELLRKGYVFDWRDSIRFPVKEFLSRFFARQGYKEGFHGLVISLLMAFYHFVIFVLIWEKRKFEKVEMGNVLDSVGKEFKKSYNETIFWFLNEKSKQAQGRVEKILLKVKKKFYKL